MIPLEMFGPGVLKKALFALSVEDEQSGVSIKAWMESAFFRQIPG